MFSLKTFWERKNDDYTIFFEQWSVIGDLLYTGRDNMREQERPEVTCIAVLNNCEIS